MRPVNNSQHNWVQRESMTTDGQWYPVLVVVVVVGVGVVLVPGTRSGW